VGLTLQVTAATIHVILIYVSQNYTELGFTGVCRATGLHFFFRWSVTHLFVTFHEKLKNPFPNEVTIFSKETISNLGD
jgi:Na+-driven multidrug efflux pump